MSMLARVFVLARPTLRCSTFQPIVQISQRFAMSSSSNQAQVVKSSVVDPAAADAVAFNKGRNDLTEADGDTTPAPIYNLIDPATAILIKEAHPNENAEDAIACYAFPRNVMMPIEGPFGTWKRPCLLPSANDSRIIACTGGTSDVAGYGQFHEAAWLVVRDNGKKHACDECGQVFKLLRLQSLGGVAHATHSH